MTPEERRDKILIDRMTPGTDLRVLIAEAIRAAESDAIESRAKMFEDKGGRDNWISKAIREGKIDTSVSTPSNVADAVCLATTSNPCHVCKGSGKIPMIAFDTEYPATCYACSGRGTIASTLPRDKERP